MRRLALLAALLALAASWPVAAARADGDPASDVLLQQDVFLPYSLTTSQGTASALAELTQRTRKAGWPIKVAIINSADDLGSAAQYATDPQGYANFLASELGGGPGQGLRLLVVTPVGFGGENLGRGVDTVLSKLSAGDHPDGDALGKLALDAIGGLAAADGHRVAVPAVDLSGTNARPYRSDVTLHGGKPATRPRGAKEPGKGGGGGGTVLAVLGPLLLLGLGIGAVALRQRRRVTEP